MATFEQINEELSKKEAEFIGMNFADKPDIAPILAKDGIVWGKIGTTDTVFFVKMSAEQVESLVKQVLEAHEKYNRLKSMRVL